MASLQQQAVQSQPQNQLERLLQSEDACLNLEHEQVQDDQRRNEAQKRFLSQMDFYHPLRPRENTKSPKGLLSQCTEGGSLRAGELKRLLGTLRKRRTFARKR